MSESLGSQTTPTEKRLTKRVWPKWVEILITAVLTGGVTIGTGMILFRWQERQPQLVYTAANTIPFPGQNQVVGIYQLSISNEGKREVDSVECYIRVPSSNIEQKKISADTSLNLSDSVTGDTLKLHVESLNPSETVQLSILASSPSYLPPTPEVSLRGKGVSGVEKKEPDKNESRQFLTLIPAFAGAAVAMIVLMVQARQRLRRSQTGFDIDPETGQHRDDQRKVLAYICGLHGLTDQVERYLGGVPKAKYWAESDRLAATAVRSEDPVERAKIMSVLGDLLEYAKVLDESRGIVLYNLARIAMVNGDTTEANEYIAQAKSKAAKLVSARIKIDPLFKQQQR